MNILLNNVAKIFHTPREDLEILKNIELDLPAGSVSTVSGESGCGKTTLISLMAGLDKPSAGEITIFGHPVHRMNEEEISHYRSAIIGIVFQFHFLLEDFTAVENLVLPALMRGGDRKSAQRRARELLEAVDMSHRGDHVPAQLSGGERQRIAVARSLVNDPQLIFADEPTGNLDEMNSTSIANLLIDLAHHYDKTLFMVTHDESLAKRGDYCFRLHGGVLHIP